MTHKIETLIKYLDKQAKLCSVYNIEKIWIQGLFNIMGQRVYSFWVQFGNAHCAGNQTVKLIGSYLHTNTYCTSCRISL